MARDRRLVDMLAIAYGAPFVWVGVQHFVRPEIFVAIMPTYFAWPIFWVYLTGCTEITLGLGVMIRRHRRLASWLMAVQLCLLYLANLHMWMNDIAFDGVRFGTVGHVVRLFVQLLLLAAAVGFARTARRS